MSEGVVGVEIDDGWSLGRRNLQRGWMRREGKEVERRRNLSWESYHRHLTTRPSL